MFKEELCGAVEALRALEQVKVVRLQPPPAAFPAGLCFHAAPAHQPLQLSLSSHTRLLKVHGG